MKIAYVTNIKIPALDAQSLQVMKMAKGFYQKLGSDFLLVTPRNSENTKRITAWTWSRFFTVNRLPRILRYFLNLFFSLHSIVKFHPNVVFSRDIGIVCFYHLLGYKTVYEIHKPFVTLIGNWLFKLMSHKIFIVSISQALKEDVSKIYKIELAKILVAHDGVDPGDYQLLNESERIFKKKTLFDVRANDFVILYVGSLQKGKGKDVLVYLASRFAQLDPRAKFFILGAEQPANDNALIKYLGYKPNSQMPQYLVVADLLILPNTKELSYFKYTSPLKMFEYLASGRPILASNLGAINEILDETNAYLFDPDNLTEAIEKIRYIIEDPSKAEARSKRGLEIVKNYSWLIRAEKIINFLDSVYEIKK